MSRCGWHVFSLQLGYWCLQAWFCIPNLAVYRTAIKPPFGLSNLWSECADSINLQESGAAANPQNQTYLIRHCFWFTSCTINKMPIYFSLTEASISIPFGHPIQQSQLLEQFFSCLYTFIVSSVIPTIGPWRGHVWKSFIAAWREAAKLKKNMENAPIQAN